MLVLFSPDYPEREFYTIVPIFMELGFFATLDIHDDFQFAMAWEDATWMAEDPVLEAVAETKPVLNLRCRDISKTRVESVFSAVFGYSTFVDPLQHEGMCVRKYDENAIGGTIVRCPLASREEGFVYQKFIDSSRNGVMIEYRLPVILQSLPVVYTLEKEIPVHAIKTGKNSVRISNVHDVFSSSEQARILEFCREMKLDFGELDILRANEDGRLYILDANKTPGGFGMRNNVHWDAGERRRAIGILAEAFKAAIVKRLP